uniref:Uncharacterized protein n=1 Tax=Rhizophora mucronata TaxID=61149 RepID=A0A2P2KMF7_RHIMU
MSGFCFFLSFFFFGFEKLNDRRIRRSDRRGRLKGGAGETPEKGGDSGRERRRRGNGRLEW